MGSKPKVHKLTEDQRRARRERTERRSALRNEPIPTNGLKGLTTTKFRANLVVMKKEVGTLASALDIFTSIGQLKMLSYILSQIGYEKGKEYHHTAARVEAVEKRYGYSRSSQSGYIKEMVLLKILVRVKKGEYQVNEKMIELIPSEILYPKETT